MKNCILKIYSYASIIISMVIGLSSCTNTHPEKQSDKAAPDSLLTDSAQIHANIISFLRWYKVNINKANDLPLLIKDSAGNFLVNNKACADYLNYINSSGFLSPKFITTWQAYFDGKAIELQHDKIKEDVPDGFDFDFILITQEPEIVLNKIDSMQFNFISINDTTATVEMKLPSDLSIDYEFDLFKEKAGWQIVYISTQNYD